MPKLEALILDRRDFRETSRLVTLVTRERGKLVALAKGAHRPNSSALGRLDLLNRCEVTLSGRGLLLLGRVGLLHEPRALRRPPRFLVAMHLVEIFDRAFLEGRADPELFDLLSGGLTLVERADVGCLVLVLAGLEIRFLGALGLSGPLTACNQCGASLTRAHAGKLGGVFCAACRPPGSQPVARPVLEWLGELSERPGREWPGMTVPSSTRAALDVLGSWLTAALEFRPRTRALAIEALRRSSRARG